MEDIFFTDAGEAPVPPDEVRIRELEVAPRRDGTRVDVRSAITPFQKRPNVELSILDGAGEEVASLSVVEAIDPNMDFTMHIRGGGNGDYTLTMEVFYAEVEEHESGEGEQHSASEILERAKQVVDTRSVDFHIG